jgi:mono/diheme cytochrome c family protein
LALPVATLVFHRNAPAQDRSATPTDAFSLADWPLDAAATRGSEVFGRYCIGCHGPTGEGNGPAAEHLSPGPRDFQRGGFKFRSTPYGAPPTRDDVMRTVTCGLPGSSMPSFSLLSEPERRDVVEFVLSLFAFGRARREVDFYRQDEGLSMEVIRRDRLPAIRDEVLDAMKRDAAPVAVPATPEPTAESVEHGRELFAKQCASCHGPTGVGDGPSSATLRDWKDGPIRPRDFTTGVFRAGSSPRALYVRIKTGISGTPMPANTGSDQDLWDIVAYVGSLKRADARPDKHIGPGCGGMDDNR